MNKTKRTRLEARGWRVGSAKDFLGLSPEEAALVETRLALSQALRSRRVAHGLTQGELARRLKSSQSRVAKMEAGDRTVSVDLLVKALFSLGAKPRDVGRALQRRGTAAAYPNVSDRHVSSETPSRIAWSNTSGPARRGR